MINYDLPLLLVKILIHPGDVVLKLIDLKSSCHDSTSTISCQVNFKFIK